MPKGYWIARVDVSDPEAYKSYVAANAAPLAEFGGRFLVRGGRAEPREGHWRTRQVIIEFPSYEAALACYDSLGYRGALKLREASAEGDLLIVEGYDGPQPGER